MTIPPRPASWAATETVLREMIVIVKPSIPDTYSYKDVIMSLVWVRRSIKLTIASLDNVSEALYLRLQRLVMSYVWVRRCIILTIAALDNVICMGKA